VIPTETAGLGNASGGGRPDTALRHGAGPRQSRGWPPTARCAGASLPTMRPPSVDPVARSGWCWRSPHARSLPDCARSC